MSGRTVADFIAYWEDEGLTYARHGDYDWMASLVPGSRVLEIGCGLGFATQALVARGLSVMAIDTLPECLALTRQRVGDAVTLLQADVEALDEAQRATIERFAPDCVVCWLMGAPAELTGATASDGGQAVAAYRERVHRAVASLAASLPGVRALHIVDRTAIPWQAKDIGRDTLVRYHLERTFSGLPFSASRSNALYRKLGGNVASLAKSHPALKSVVPTLASLLATRSL
jgi:SAM-dependent methyltransferase